MKIKKIPKTPKGVKVSIRSYKELSGTRCNRSGGACSGGGTCGQ